MSWLKHDHDYVEENLWGRTSPTRGPRQNESCPLWWLYQPQTVWMVFTLKNKIDRESVAAFPHLNIVLMKHVVYQLCFHVFHLYFHGFPHFLFIMVLFSLFHSISLLLCVLCYPEANDDLLLLCHSGPHPGLLLVQLHTLTLSSAPSIVLLSQPPSPTQKLAKHVHSLQLVHLKNKSLKSKTFYIMLQQIQVKKRFCIFYMYWLWCY